MNILGLFKKALTGASDEDNAKNKARMREIFNEAVPMVMIINWYIVILKITIVLLLRQSLIITTLSWDIRLVK